MISFHRREPLLHYALASIGSFGIDRLRTGAFAISNIHNIFAMINQ